MDSNLRISSGAVSDRGLSEKRPQNEDSYLEMVKCGVYAVADGVGGAQAGEVASQMAMEILAEAFTNRHDGDDAEIVMRTAIERANAAINQMAHELPQLSSMATTIVALHLAGNIATIGHVGDSRLYRVDRDGTLYRETDDHSMVAEEVRAGRMTEEQAENHPNRNIISRALGAEPNVTIDLKTIMVDAGTAFLICSDGITRHVVDEEIKGVLTFGGEAAEICEYLKGLCYERGAEDNLTAVVVKVTGEEDVVNETVSLELSADEEPTLATARTVENWKPNDDDDHLLELDTPVRPAFGEDTIPLADNPTIEIGEPTLSLEDRDSLRFGEETISQFDDEDLKAPGVAEHVITWEPEPEPIAEPIQAVNESASASPMFGVSGYSDVDDEKPSSLGRIAAAVGMLVLGAAIGLGVYHFALAPKLIDSGNQPLPEMKSENIPFSSFEKLRRTVDADPVAYLNAYNKEVPPADDAEDFYLLGRANLLVGDYAKAKSNFLDAQKLADKSDQTNAKVLATDIATALVIASDANAQAKLKEQLASAVKPAANTGANSNANRK